MAVLLRRPLVATLATRAGLVFNEHQPPYAGVEFRRLRTWDFADECPTDG